MFKSLLIVLVLMVASVFAQIDSTMVMVRKGDLPQNLLAKIETEQKIETYGKWAGMGKEIGISIREGLGALTEETNKFADTKVGVFVMFIIAFKVVGYAIIQLIVGVPLVLIGTIVFLWYFRNSCIRRRVLTKVTGTGKEQVKEYETENPNEDYYAFAASAWYILYLGICMAVIFAH